MSGADLLGAPLEELEFLARSPNRVAVLGALTDGPVGRYDLEDETGVTRATLGRILDDFEARGWVVETDRRYEATQLGAYVSREFGAVLERFEPVPALEAVAQWFPPDGFGFDLGHLAGADVIRSSRENVLAPTAHISRRIREAEHVRLITYSVLPGVLDVCWRGTVDGQLELEGVLEVAAVNGVGTDPHLREQAAEMFETGRSTVYVYDGDIPSTVFVIDDLVLLCLSGGEGAPLAVIETTDAAVRSWAEAMMDELQRECVPLDGSMFGA